MNVAKLSFWDLIKAPTAEDITTSLLSIAQSVGLPTTTWHKLDPTLSIVKILSEWLAGWASTILLPITGGLLDFAEDAWLTLLAKNVYNVDRILERHATGKVQLTNTGAESLTLAPGDVIISSSASGKQYRSTSGGLLAAGATLVIDVIALEAGTASSAGVAALDTVVSGQPSVSASNLTALLGADRQSDVALRALCRDSLAMLSPSGAKGAYAFVAKSSHRDDGTVIAINRVTVVATNGVVTTYVAGPSGAPIAADVAEIDDEIQTRVVPLGVTATTVAADELNVSIEYVAYTTGDPVVAKSAIDAALANLIATYPIGGRSKISGQTGSLWHDLVRSTIRCADESVFTVDLYNPPADVPMAVSVVPTMGTNTGVVTGVTL